MSDQTTVVKLGTRGDKQHVVGIRHHKFHPKRAFR
jgi:hypothetical protein